MILDHSVLFGMADTHDRHRDMRLDVDNMSYEVRMQHRLHFHNTSMLYDMHQLDFSTRFQELLALEERIGNVCTGLSEETVTSRLKRRKYLGGKAKNAAEMEPCSICRVRPQHSSTRFMQNRSFQVRFRYSCRCCVAGGV